MLTELLGAVCTDQAQVAAVLRRVSWRANNGDFIRLANDAVESQPQIFDVTWQDLLSVEDGNAAIVPNAIAKK